MFINRYAFWDPTTWQIPKLYWDAFSDEQRIHAICKQLGKVIAYADYVGVNVDDIASRLKAIEEGQLDPYIVAKIEEWFNENQPEIMRLLDAHTQEIQILGEEIDLIGSAGWVTTNRIADGAVTAAKLNPDVMEAISTAASLDRFNGAVSLGFGDSNMESSYHATRNIYRRICDKLGCEYHNKGVSSSGWQERSGYASVIEQVNAESDVDASDVKLVVVLSGINDYHYIAIDYTNFRNAVKNALNRITAKYPNAIVVTMFDSGMQLPRADMLEYEYIVMDETIRHQHCINVAIADLCCDSRHLWNNQNHYNDNGAEVIASRVCTTLAGGSFGAIPGEYFSAVYTQSEPTDTGWYGITTWANIIIDPFELKRYDMFGFDIGTNFANVDSSITQTGNGSVLFEMDCLMPRGNMQASTSPITLAMWRTVSGNISSNMIPMWIRQKDYPNMTENPKITIASRFNTDLTMYQNHVGSYHDMFVTYGR